MRTINLANLPAGKVMAVRCKIQLIWSRAKGAEGICDLRLPIARTRFVFGFDLQPAREAFAKYRTTRSG